LPGVHQASILTNKHVDASSPSRRRNQALLRLRGASQRQLMLLAGADGLIIGLIGALAGLGLGAITLRLALHRWSFGNNATSTLTWGLVAAAVGIGLSLLVMLLPTWQDNRRQTVAMQRRSVTREGPPRWERFGVDLLLIAASAVIYWNARRHGYEVLLAPEGVPRVSVS
jgi:putative ABC transport system permease protein